MNEVQNEGAILLKLIDEYILKTGGTKRFVADALGITHTLLSKREKLAATERLNTETATKAAAFFGYPFERATNGASGVGHLSEVREAVGAAYNTGQTAYTVAELTQIREQLEHLRDRVDALINTIQK